MSNFSSGDKFNISKSGMRSDVIARLVPINSSILNMSGLFTRTLIATPGCKLLLPGKDGTLILTPTDRSRSSSVIHIRLLEAKQRVAIEFRETAFTIKLPITIHRGYNVKAQTDDDTSYNVRLCLQITDIATLLEALGGVSMDKPEITLTDVSNSLADDIVTLLGNTCDIVTNSIDFRSLYRYINRCGLYVMGRPTITDYTSGRLQHLRQKQADADNRRQELIRNRTNALAELTTKTALELPKLESSLAASGLNRDEITKALTDYRSNVSAAAADIKRTYDQAIKDLEDSVEASIRDSRYRDDRRPDRLYSHEAQSLYGDNGRSNNYLGNQDGHKYEFRSQRPYYSNRRPYSDSNHNAYDRPDDPANTRKKPFNDQHGGYFTRPDYGE